MNQHGSGVCCTVAAPGAIWRVSTVAQKQHMTPSEIADEHATEAHAPYLTVWAWLAFLTAVEYVYAYMCQEILLTPFLVTLLGLLIWAAIKAGLVGWFFMHLKFEGAWVYGLIIPACILAAILVLGLTPDVAFRPVDEGQAEEEVFRAAPPSKIGVARSGESDILARTASEGPAIKSPVFDRSLARASG
jgi:cytochrome c oxidase subunit IV